MSKQRVLIVEDDKDVARVTRGFVERHPDFAVIAEAATGRAALEAIFTFKPDLVLLDIYLPDTTGIAVLRAARARGYAGEVVAVTAASEVETVRRARQLGVRHYLVKPFTMSAMHERLDAVNQSLAREQVLTMTELSQGDIDRLLTDSRAPVSTPSDGSSITLDRVAEALAGVDGSASAIEIAAATGLSRVSARRYLQRLVDAGRADVEPRYGSAGRPEMRYTPARREN